MLESKTDVAKERLPVAVEFLGFSSRTANTLTLALSGPARGHCQIVAGEHAEAAILDGDGENAEVLRGRYAARHPRRPILVVSTIPPRDPRVLHLRKPIRLTELKARLRDLETLVRRPKSRLPGATEQVHAVKNPVTPGAIQSPASSPREGHGPVIPAAGRATLRREATEQAKQELLYGPENRRLETLLHPIEESLLETLQEAVSAANQVQHPHQVLLRDTLLFVIDPRSGTIAGPDDEPGLIVLSRKKFARNSLRIRKNHPASNENRPPHNASMRVDDVETWLWKLSLWTYQGKLPADTDLSARVYLRYWPNLTRLQHIPHAMKIAALWSKQRVTLKFTASALNISERYVFAFYSATRTIGLSGPARREADYLVEQYLETEPPSRAGFIRQLLRRVTGGAN